MWYCECYWNDNGYCCKHGGCWIFDTDALYQYGVNIDYACDYGCYWHRYCYRVTCWCECFVVEQYDYD